MRELLRTNDPVMISALVAYLSAEGIEAFVFDSHASIMDGSVGAVPRRIMVDDSDYYPATIVLRALEEERG